MDAYFGFTVAPIEDCGYEAFAYTWQDHKQNGIWDNGEKPLGGVPLRLGGVENDDVRSESVPSDADGKTKLLGWSGGCPQVRFEISAVAPSGFLATTPLRQPSTSAEPMDAYFGFTDGPMLSIQEQQRSILWQTENLIPHRTLP